MGDGGWCPRRTLVIGRKALIFLVLVRRGSLPRDRSARAHYEQIGPDWTRRPSLPSYKLPLPAHWNRSYRAEAFIAVSANGLPMAAEADRLA